MMEMTSKSQTDEAALFADDDDEASTSAIIRQHNVEAAKESRQREKSLQKTSLKFDGVEAGGKVQTIKELMHVPVIVTSDMTKSPPVLKVFSVNHLLSIRHE